MSKSKILFQMTGSIACFKACMLLSKLVQAGHEVQVVASSSALRFVGNATIEGLTGKPVVSDLFAAGHVMEHIHLVRWADLILVAPASANFINKAAHGLGDDLIATQFLAHDFQKPFLVAPAMNTAMYLHPTTQDSIRRLKEMGVEILETASGVLACGEIGWGRLLEPELIFQEVIRRLPGSATGSTSLSLQEKVPASSFSRQANSRISASHLGKILITSGGTQEPLDPVRFITNLSTGSTGAALADVLLEMGFDVTYVHARNAIQPQSECEKISFQTYEDLATVLRTNLPGKGYKAVIQAAAVSDFSPVQPRLQKISSDDILKIEFKKNPKLVDQLRTMAQDAGLQVIGFKMTATPVLSERFEAVQKIFKNSKANLVVHNDLSEINPSQGQHRFHVHAQTGDPVELNGKQELGLHLGEYLMRTVL